MLVVEAKNQTLRHEIGEIWRFFWVTKIVESNSLVVVCSNVGNVNKSFLCCKKVAVNRIHSWNLSIYCSRFLGFSRVLAPKSVDDVGIYNKYYHQMSTIFCLVFPPLLYHLTVDNATRCVCLTCLFRFRVIGVYKWLFLHVLLLSLSSGVLTL